MSATSPSWYLVMCNCWIEARAEVAGTAVGAAEDGREKDGRQTEWRLSRAGGGASCHRDGGSLQVRFQFISVSMAFCIWRAAGSSMSP
eukprot:1006018-Prymnesium_polylepis.2